jgi:hypothetical protein
MVLPDSRKISRVPRYSGSASRKTTCFRLHGFHVLWRAFPSTSANTLFGNFPACARSTPTTPATRVTGLGSSRFARRYSGNHGCFLFLQVLRWFTSLGSPPLAGLASKRLGYPIRKSPYHCLLAAPRGLSQLATSFIACMRQGIHQAPLLA